MAERTATGALVVLLVLAGAVGWWTVLRPPLHADATRLADLPLHLGPWEGVDLPLEETVESMLRADANVQRAYQHPVGGLVWLYVGYYGTQRGGTPEHTPRACYTAHGWEIAAPRRLLRDPQRALHANEFVVMQGGHRRLVHFWYRSFRSPDLLSPVALRVDHVLGQWTAGRGDGALVRISTPVEGDDLVGARSRLLGFATLLEPELARVWPMENSAS